VTHCCIWLDRAVQLHRCSPFLDDLGIFPVKTSFLVLLHSSDLFLKPVTCITSEFNRRIQIFDSPLLRTLIFISIASWCQTVGKSRFLLNSLSTTHISADNRRITNDFCLPAPINLSIELVTDTKNNCHHTNRLMRKTLLLFSGPTLISRSRSSEEPLLKAGESDVDGPGKTGDWTVVYGKVSRRTEGCLCSCLISLASLLSSSAVHCGSSFRLSESN
jgi:hypothetical protein